MSATATKAQPTAHRAHHPAPSQIDLRTALLPSPTNVPPWARNLPYTNGTILERPRALPYIPGFTAVKTPIRLKRRPIGCIFCGTRQKERTYDVCANCYNLAKNEAERAFLLAHPEVLDLPLEQQETVLSAITPFRVDLYKKYATAAARETVQFSYTNDPQWQLAARILTKRLARAKAAARALDPSGAAEIPLLNSMDLPVLLPADHDMEEADTRNDDSGYDGHFEDYEPSINSGVRYRAASPDHLIDADTARARARTTSTMSLAMDRVAFVHELDHALYLDNEAIDTDIHAQALADDTVRFPAPQPVELRNGWTRTATTDICPCCWKGTMSLMRHATASFYACSDCDNRISETEYADAIDRGRQHAMLAFFPGAVADARKRIRKIENRRPDRPAPRPMTDAQIAQWDREVDQLLRRGQIAEGGLLEHAGLGIDDAAWAAEHRGTQLPAFQDDPPYVRVPHPHILHERMALTFQPWGQMQDISASVEIVRIVQDVALQPGSVASLSDLGEMITSHDEHLVVEDHATVWTDPTADNLDAMQESAAERRASLRIARNAMDDRLHGRIRHRRSINPTAMHQIRARIYDQRAADRARLATSIRRALKAQAGVNANLARANSDATLAAA